jgi:hypothetical protein
MSSPRGSVTHWLGQLKAGDHATAQELWQRYFRRLVVLAGKILPRQVRRAWMPWFGSLEFCAIDRSFWFWEIHATEI